MEQRHHVSKSASDDFWRLASSAFPKLHRAKVNEMITNKIPQFTSQRLKTKKKEVPDITLEVAYQNNDTEEITVVQSEKTPKNRFNPQTYTKLYEIASVQVLPIK